MRFPIYVASKGRPAAQTFTTLSLCHLSYTVLVEPQEADAYTKVVKDDERIHVLPDDDRGLAFARQQALEHARTAGHEWYWMLDDDIKGFYRAHDGKTWSAPADELLTEAEELILAGGEFVAQGSLEYQQFAWSNEPGKVTLNSYCDVAVLTRTGTLASFREELPLKVDRDFTLQVIAGGHDTVRCGALAFAVPRNGSNEGGQHDVYDSLTDEGMRREEWASRRLAELWPHCVEFKMKPNGRPDAKIHWRKARG